MQKKLRLKFINHKYSIVQLAKDAAIPEWVDINDDFVSITRTGEELSIVCKSTSVPEKRDIIQSNGWIIIKIEDSLDLSLVGILYSIVKILKQNNISLFAILTYNTDYILIKKVDKAKAIQCLSRCYDII